MYVISEAKSVSKQAILITVTRGLEPMGVHETLMIAKHEMCIDFYGASERWINLSKHEDKSSK